MGVKALLWTDFETSGLRPVEHELLEVGVVLTPFEDFQQFDLVYEQVLKLTNLARIQLYGGPVHSNFYESGYRLYERNQFLLDMHGTSGLLEDCEASDVTVSDVDEELSTQLEALGYGENDLQIAGSGVAGFDLQFVHEQMPRLDRLVHYAPFDLGLFRRGWRNLGGERVLKLDTPSDSSGPDKKHRALDDVLAHIREAQRYQQQIASLVAAIDTLAE